MTTQALDANAIITVAGGIARQPTPEGTATRPDALSPLLARQRAAFLRNGPPSLAARRANLKKLRAALLARRADFEAALDVDFGHRSRHETAIMEMLVVTWGIDYLHRNLRRFMRRERRHVALPMRRRPRVRRISAARRRWHRGPLELSVLARADATRDRPRRRQHSNEQAVGAHTGDERFPVSLIAETFSEDEVAVITSDASVGAAFSALPFDHLFFTGSTAVGRAMMRAASEQLVPVTLELGGKSPVSVDRGQPLARVATDIAYGKLANAGQTCVAPDYMLLARS